MKNNEALQEDVQKAIKWEPLMDAAEIGVIAKDGIVTLTGTVDSYAKKLEAERAAKKVKGVEAIVEKIEVKFGSFWNKSDSEIAREAVNALKSDFSVPDDKIQARVENGWVSLEGAVGWNYQRESAVNSVKYLSGVKGITNKITIKSELTDDIEKKDIEDALDRNWSIEEQDIEVVVSGNKVTLLGTVSSWYDRDEAERITWNTPGICAVDNELIVDYDYAMAD